MVIACIRETIKDQRGQENCSNNVRIIVNVTASVSASVTAYTTQDERKILESQCPRRN